MSGPCKAVVTFTVARKSTVLWRGAGGGGVQACTRRQSAAGDGVPPSLQIPPHTRILLARSPAPYSPFCQGAHPPTAFSGPMARPSLPLASSSLTHTRRMDCFCNQNADQLGSLAGLSFPAVYVGLVECAPASPYTYSSSTHRFPKGILVSANTRADRRVEGWLCMGGRRNGFKVVITF